MNSYDDSGRILQHEASAFRAPKFDFSQRPLCFAKRWKHEDTLTLRKRFCTQKSFKPKQFYPGISKFFRKIIIDLNVQISLTSMFKKPAVRFLNEKFDDDKEYSKREGMSVFPLFHMMQKRIWKNHLRVVPKTEALRFKMGAEWLTYDCSSRKL